MFNHLRIFLIVLLLSVCAPAFAQLQAVFPEANEEISYADIQSQGFSWFAAPGATQFKLDISRFTSSFVQLTQTYEGVTETNFVPPASDQSFFEPGQYQWTITITAGENTGTSITIPFTLAPPESIIPTPTPNVTATPVPDGQSTPTSTPTPVVDMPRDITFNPSSVLTFSETQQLTINWSPPAFPATGSFVYDLIVIWPQGIVEDTQFGLTEATYKPFEIITTQMGVYTVHIRATDTNTGLQSNIATAAFEVVRNTVPTPTPTPVVRDPDFSGDGEITASDLAIFIRALNSHEGDPNYDSRLDFIADDTINRQDLLVFISLFSQRNQKLSAPVWTFADVPELSPVNEFSCEIVGRLEPVEFPPNEFTFGLNPECNVTVEVIGEPQSTGLPEGGTKFHFSEVPGAVDYRITLDTELSVFTGNEFETDGETFFTLFTTQRGTVDATVQALGPDGAIGETSETLHVVIPN